MERGVEWWQLIDLTRYGLVPISRQRRQRRDLLIFGRRQMLSLMLDERANM
jgi:hypothetical protein